MLMSTALAARLRYADTRLKEHLAVLTNDDGAFQTHFTTSPVWRPSHDGGARYESGRRVVYDNGRTVCVTLEIEFNQDAVILSGSTFVEVFLHDEGFTEWILDGYGPRIATDDAEVLTAIDEAVTAITRTRGSLDVLGIPRHRRPAH